MISAVIVAAGSSRRMGFDKLFVELAGKPIIAHTLWNFQNCQDINEIIIVSQPDKFDRFIQLKEQLALDKISHMVAGGIERQNSVFAGIKSTQNDTTFVVIHDGARPLCTPNMIHQTVETAKKHGASVAASKVVDTMKEANDDLSIKKTVDRSQLWAVQTPQVFEKSIIIEAYEEVFRRGMIVTDDTAALELLGIKAYLVDTGRGNIKITTPEDLAIAEILLGKNRRDLIRK